MKTFKRYLKCAEGIFEENIVILWLAVSNNMKLQWKSI